MPLLLGLNMSWDYEDDYGDAPEGCPERGKEVLGVGLLFFVMDSLEGSGTEDAEGLTARLKCFTDETKMKILFLLAQQDCYQAEIARRLKLTPATISHHLDMLHNNGIIPVSYTHLDVYKRQSRDWEKIDALYAEYDGIKIDYPYGQFILNNDNIQSYIANINEIHTNYMKQISFGKYSGTAEEIVAEYQQALKDRCV